jgi:hypothetical protein
MKPDRPACILGALFLLGALLLDNLGLLYVAVFYIFLAVLISILPRESVETFLEAG